MEEQHIRKIQNHMAEQGTSDRLMAEQGAKIVKELMAELGCSGTDAAKAVAEEYKGQLTMVLEN